MATVNASIKVSALAWSPAADADKSTQKRKAIMHSLETLHKLNAAHAGRLAQLGYLSGGLRGRMDARAIVRTFLDESAADPAEVAAFFGEYTGDGEEVLGCTRDHGGCTWSLRTGRQPSTGYAVGVNPDCAERIEGRQFTLADVQAYIVKHCVKLAQPDAHLGTWVDVGTNYLDVSVVEPNLTMALALGRTHGQMAVYDLATGTTIEVARTA